MNVRGYSPTISSKVLADTGKCVIRKSRRNFETVPSDDQALRRLSEVYGSIGGNQIPKAYARLARGSRCDRDARA
jgi:hypothetical protein